MDEVWLLRHSPRFLITHCTDWMLDLERSITSAIDFHLLVYTLVTCTYIRYGSLFMLEVFVNTLVLRQLGMYSYTMHFIY